MVPVTGQIWTEDSGTGNSQNCSSKSAYEAVTSVSFSQLTCALLTNVQLECINLGDKQTGVYMYTVFQKSDDTLALLMYWFAATYVDVLYIWANKFDWFE